MDFKSIFEQIELTQHQLPQWQDLNQFVGEFNLFWRKLGNLLQQQLVQAQIEQTEAQERGARTKRKKRYYTPLGEMVIERRVYATDNGLKVKVDQLLGLPEHKWLPQVLELACALGVSSEFPNAHQLFVQWTGISLTEKTLANQVEATGNLLPDLELELEKKSIPTTQKSPIFSTDEAEKLLYVGVDGVMTPLNNNQGYKEAKVGVIFWSFDHQKNKGQRGVIRKREYVATLKSRSRFRQSVCQLYHQIVGDNRPTTVVIGDGAHWIWEMSQEQFPGSIEILDFFHLSEYVWAVAKAAYPKLEQHQKDWVKTQQQLLKQSQWRTVIQNCHQLKRKKADLITAVNNLERYLHNNQTRIDYQAYLQAGLMIGSGVVESSNRRVVTQRLKQAGMHWSKTGAEGVMALRAVYLSSQDRWSSFWSVQSKLKVKLA